MNDPSQLTRPRRPKRDTRVRTDHPKPGGPRTQEVPDLVHGPHQALPLGRGQSVQDRPDLVRGGGVQARERFPTRGRQREQDPAAILRRGAALDQAALAEPAHDPAEIARVQAEVDPELRGRRRPSLRELVDDPRLCQRKRALEEPLLEDADPARVEAVEAPDLGDLDLGLPRDFSSLVKGCPINDIAYAGSLEFVKKLFVDGPYGTTSNARTRRSTSSSLHGIGRGSQR